MLLAVFLYGPPTKNADIKKTQSWDISNIESLNNKNFLLRASASKNNFLGCVVDPPYIYKKRSCILSVAFSFSKRASAARSASISKSISKWK
jgi:hypothetical protein